MFYCEYEIDQNGLWALNGHWCPGACVSENEDIIFINKPHIWSPNKYIFAEKNNS